MIRFKFFALGSVLACGLTIGASAQQQQQIAFIGDSPTVAWGQQPQFQAHTNWIDDGKVAPGNYGATAATLTELQTIIASGKKPIIHLLVGQDDSGPQTAGNPHSSIFAGWASTFEKIITTAQQAKLTIIVGTIPFTGPGQDVSTQNKWILTYCAAHSIPVVNYDFALNSNTGFAAGGAGSPSLQPNTRALPVPVYFTGTAPSLTPTSAAWDVMTDMAQTAIILAEGYKLKSGYLNTVVFQGNSITDFEDYPTVNGNSVADGGTVQFTPYGQYSDGSTHVINNADINGHIGTWTNSNAIALALDQNGVGIGLDQGSTNVHFTTLSGVTFSEWVMNTTIDEPGCSSNCATY